MKNLLVCIDIGGTSMKAGVCDMEGLQVRKSSRFIRSLQR